MTWVYTFLAVAAISALFGFGILASADVARLLSVIFFILAIGAAIQRWRSGDDVSVVRRTDR